MRPFFETFVFLGLITGQFAAVVAIQRLWQREGDRSQTEDTSTRSAKPTTAREALASFRRT